MLYLAWFALLRALWTVGLHGAVVTPVQAVWWPLSSPDYLCVSCSSLGKCVLASKQRLLPIIYNLKIQLWTCVGARRMIFFFPGVYEHPVVFVSKPKSWIDFFRSLLFKSCCNYSSWQTDRCKVQSISFIGCMKQFKLLHLCIAIFTRNLESRWETTDIW